MNTLIEFFQGLAAQVPDLLQPFIIAAAGAIPFIEGEVSSIIGVWAGMNPVLAGIAGAIGNFGCVTVIVVLGARARRAVVARQSQKRELVSTGSAIGTGAAGLPVEESPVHTPAEAAPSLTEGAEGAQGHGRLGEDTKPEPKGRRKFKRFLTRFGVPGASLLGPLATPPRSRRRSSSAPG